MLEIMPQNNEKYVKIQIYTKLFVEFRFLIRLTFESK